MLVSGGIGKIVKELRILPCRPSFLPCDIRARSLGTCKVINLIGSLEMEKAASVHRFLPRLEKSASAMAWCGLRASS